MYQTCEVHMPMPCSVVDEDYKLFCCHDRYLLAMGEVHECPEEGISPEST
jgi:hypothetical protein